jgi:hypothetical protein
MEFILSAVDHDLVCSVLEARFFPSDLQQLAALIPDADIDAPRLWDHNFELDDANWRSIVTAFAIPFDTAGLEERNCTIQLRRPHSISKAPFLIHTNFELLLLLNGQKKLARMGNEYPPMTFYGEDAFERHVASGDLHREEVIEPFDKPIRQWLGHRTVYYTPKGEEWRIQAMKLIWTAFPKTGGWNESYERLEGMLFGYEDWQSDWWAAQQKRRGGSFYGIPFCCTVASAGLAFIESTGWKALPPADDIILYSFDHEDAGQPERCLTADSQAVAVVRFSAAPRFITDIIDYKTGGPWRIPAAKIPSLNGKIRGAIEIVVQRP